MTRAFTRCLLSAGLLAAAAAAMAAPPVATQSEDETIAAAADETTATATTAAPRAASADDRHCLRYTGSHLQRSARKGDRQPECIRTAPGRAYTREDIERTGAMDVKDALRRLDPAVY